MKRLIASKAAIALCFALMGATLGSSASAGVVVGGVNYDYVGIVKSVSGSNIVINNRQFLLGISGNVRNGKSVAPLAVVQPGTYVGVTVRPVTLGGLPMVTSLSILPQ